jgi:hypothetical protein
MHRTIKLALILFAAAGISSAGVVFTLDPVGGLLAGGAGTSVGWGLTISTDSGAVTIQSFTFEDLTPVGTFVQFVPSGIATPGSPIIAPWIEDSSGLQYDIDPGAPFPGSTSGLMSVIYDTYTDSSLSEQIGFGDTVNATSGGIDVSAEVDVNSPGSAVPEPGTAVLLAGGALLCGGLRRLRRAGHLRSES